MSESSSPIAPVVPTDFIRDIVAADLSAGIHDRVVTRFPPEPNGYLHLGHAKSICLNFGIARENGGQCNLRMDDTNPTKEELQYVDAIHRDVRWLIDGWACGSLGLKLKGSQPTVQTLTGPNDFHLPSAINTGAKAETLEPFFASDYFETLYAFAEQLIEQGDAYVCDLSPEDTDRLRGSPDRPGTDSPFRNRGRTENLALLREMRNGLHKDGSRTLRAKIDMTSPNVWLRDPILYRIRHAEHHHTGMKWCIYPMYDFAHCISDYIEGVTHSICTLEFEVHRPLYDWILNKLKLQRPLPKQHEFARLNLTYTVLSKRKLSQLVKDGLVSGWDDPRLPTLSGLRRRGVTAKALRDFSSGIGVTKYNALTDVAVLEKAVRDDLNRIAQRRMAVINPIRMVLTNIPPGENLPCLAINNPEDPAMGSRPLCLTRDVWIERNDFMESPPPKYFRLCPGGQVRLKYACIVQCQEVVKDSTGSILEIRCVADLTTRNGEVNSGRKVKGTIHWVSASEAIDADIRLYDRLFAEPEPDKDGRDFLSVLNPNSLEVASAKLEPALSAALDGQHFQFERLGYFYPDIESRPDKLVFNRTIALKDTWAKVSG